MTSRFDSGNALSFGANASLIMKLQRTQNTAARLITRKKKCEHITPVLMDLHLLPVCYIAQYKLLLYVFKALNGLAPVYLKDHVTVYEPARTLRSENAMLVVQRKCELKHGERRFDKAASTLWNSLPSNIRHDQSIEAFKKQLKTLLSRRSDFTEFCSILFNIVIAPYVDHRYLTINLYPHNLKCLPF